MDGLLAELAKSGGPAMAIAILWYLDRRAGQRVMQDGLAVVKELTLVVADLRGWLEGKIGQTGDRGRRGDA